MPGGGSDCIMKHWTLDDIPWARFDPSRVDPETLRIVKAARMHGMQLMLGCMIESTLGIAGAIQIASLMDYVDLDGAALLADDPFRGPHIDGTGVLHFNNEPGLGVSAREAINSSPALQR